MVGFRCNTLSKVPLRLVYIVLIISRILNAEMFLLWEDVDAVYGGGGEKMWMQSMGGEWMWMQSIGVSGCGCSLWR